MFGITVAVNRNFEKPTVILNMDYLLQLYSFELLHKQPMCNFVGN